MITRENLSEEQETAFKYILDFISSPDRRQMLLSGYAGTGKSSLLNVLLDHFETNRKYDIYCTAPTNEAVRVISKLTGRTKFDKTIYSLLGLALVEEDDKPPKLKVISKKCTIGDYELVFVDEASMIQSELFDIMQKQLREFSYLKVIYIGDDAQLPPVKDEGKDSKVFQIQDMVKLVQIQRTAKGNPIIEVATQIRNNLDSPVDVFSKETILLESGDGIEFHTERNKYLELMYNDFKSQEYKDNPNYVRVAAYTNKTVDALNKRIRKEIFKEADLKDYMENEDVVVDVPVIDQTDNHIVFTVGERLRVRSSKLFEDHEEGFKYWTLTVIDYESRFPTPHVINVIDKDYLRAYRLVLSKYAMKAKEDSNRVSKGEAWRPYFKFKNQFSWVKYSYAMTIHKCQGGTFNHVYVINKDCNVLSWNHVERNKLKYVAFTRASNLLRII